MSELDKEAKVGAMLRHMTGDVATGFKKFHAALYAREDGSEDDVSRSCAKWHWALVKYSPEPQAMRGYVSIIQYAYGNGVDLDKCEEWKKLMRVILPEEFLAKMATFTQVPQIAVMDETTLGVGKEDEKDAMEVDW